MANANAISSGVVEEEFPNLAADIVKFPVRSGEDAWTLTEMREIAEALLAEKIAFEAELVEADADLTDLLRNSGDGSGDDQADYGSSALEREQELTLVNNTRDLLEQNRQALARIAAGTFGTCENCGEAVGKARQQAFPRASLCVSCKQKEERR